MGSRIGIRRGLGTLLALLLIGMPAAAQFRGVLEIDSDELGPITVVPTPREIEQALQDIELLLQRQQYPEAIDLLQTLLESTEDFLQPPVDGSTWTSSVKQRARKLVRDLPAEGRKVYRVQHDAAAERLWQRYRDTADPVWALQLVRRYPMTSAYGSALGTLATVAFDRSQPLSAARWWDDLAALDPTSPPGPERIAAWFAIGRQDRGLELLKNLPMQRQWRMSGELVSTVNLQSALPAWMDTRWARPSPPSAPLVDWPQFRGDVARNAVARPAGPVGEPLWKFDTLTVPPTLSKRLAEERASDKITSADVVGQLEEQLGLDDRVKLPTFQPLVIDDLAIIRTLDHLVALELGTGQVRWRSALPFSQLFPAARFPADTVGSVHERWLRQQLEDLHQRLFRDRTTGTLSADDQFVYAIEPCPVAAPPESLAGLPSAPTVVNKLTAYDRRTGKMAWELGGRRTDAGGPFEEFFFQGPPLIVGDRLFVIAEVSSEQRLLQFRRDRTRPVLEWSQVIAAPQTALGTAMQRRLCGQSPALAGDVLICPTSFGVVVAVDPVRQLLLWGYRYPSHSTPSTNAFSAFGGLQPIDPRPLFDEEDGYWQDTIPAISSTHVVLTPRDSMELHVVDLLTGRLAWKQPRSEGLYVAGIDQDRVLVVGRRSLSARAVNDGKLLWEQPIPLPTGYGLLQPGRYLLPVEPADLWVVDTSTGRISARLKAPSGRPFGNLAAGQGRLVSQSTSQALAFAPLDQLEAQIGAALAKSAHDAPALSLRGELRLFQGEEADGIVDLRQSLALAPGHRASRLLAGVLIEGLKRDFPRYQALIDEIDRVTLDPELRFEFLELVADGLERQGNRVAAFEQYLKLIDLDLASGELKRSDGPWLVRRDRWIRGRAADVYLAAKSEEQKQIDARLRQLLDGNVEMLDRDRQFLQYFAGHPLTDSVRRRLIERLPAARADERLQQARLLADSRSASAAALATTHLARWHLDRNEWSRARPWLTKLDRELRSESAGAFGTVNAALNRWAAELGDRWQLEPPTWPAGPIEPERRPVADPSRKRVARMEIVGPVGPEYRDWSFELHDEGELAVVARDTAGRQQWTLTLPESVLPLIPRGMAVYAPPRLYHSGNYLAVSFATVFVVLETAPSNRTPTVLWHQSLAPSELSPTVALQQIVSEPLSSGRRRTYVGDRQREHPFGQLLGISAEQVIYQLGSRVVAVDPRTQETLWIRNDAPRLIEGTADAEFVAIYKANQPEHVCVLRASDGREVARRDLPGPHEWLWFHGDRLVTLRVRRNELLAEMLKLSTGQTVWQHELPLAARTYVLDNRELLILDPTGQMQAVDLTTGNVNWELPTVAVERLGYLWVSQSQGRYCVVAGDSASPRHDGSRVRTYDGTQTPFAGKVFQVDPASKRVSWEADIPLTAFEFTQPATSPVLAFVGRVIPAPRRAAVDFPTLDELSAVFIDRREGTVVYQTTETLAPDLFRWEPSGEHHSLTATFNGWQVQFTCSQSLPSKP